MHAFPRRVAAATAVFLASLLLWSPQTTSAEAVNVGTTLYARRDLHKNWTEPEATQLRARKTVDRLLPTRIPDGPAFVRYLKLIADKLKIIENDVTRRHAMVTVADALGGYMHGVLLPTVKTSYYEGRAGFDAIDKLYGTMRKIKFVLDTDGRGWITPEAAADVQTSGRTTSHAVDTTTDTAVDDDGGGGGGAELAEDPCAALRVSCAADDDAATVPVPAFDDDRRPGSLAVPFADSRRLYSVRAAFRPAPLPLYYRLAVRCTASAPDLFRRNVRHWLDAVVAPLLARSHHRWYPALAGASRVIRAASSATLASSTSSIAHRPKRRTGPDVDDWPTCDDGPDGRLPNSNVFLLVILLSLVFTWLCLGVLSVHKTIRHVTG